MSLIDLLSPVTPVTIPDHCPKCGKWLGTKIGFAILDSGAVRCIRCYHARQLARLRRLPELSEIAVRALKAWRRIQACQQFFTYDYWRHERHRLARVAEHHTDEIPVIEVELSHDEVA